MPFKMHKIIYFFPEKKIKKIICVPTLPKIFRPVIKTHLFFHLALYRIWKRVASHHYSKCSKILNTFPEV